MCTANIANKRRNHNENGYATMNRKNVTNNYNNRGNRKVNSQMNKNKGNRKRQSSNELNAEHNSNVGKKDKNSDKVNSVIRDKDCATTSCNCSKAFKDINSDPNYYYEYRV